MPHAHHFQSLRVRLTLALAAASCLLAVAASVLLPSTVRAAEAKGYGELARFGETGNIGGKEDPGTTGKLDELRTDALGVDPSEGNSVFVLDEPRKRTGTERFYRLQKFTESSGTYSLSASVEFQEKYPKVAVGEEGEAEPAIDGLAVDPNGGVVYLLAVDLREKKLSVDSGGPGNTDLQVASTLFAFSTKTEAGAKLVPATGTKEPNPKEIGVLTGPEELGSQSVTAGQALLEPHGITVDPVTGEVIVLAHIDTSGAKEDSVADTTDHYVLQRISPTGVLGDRYEDKTNKLKEKLIQGFTPTPHSPIVVSVAGTEHVYVGFDGLAEIPLNFKSSTAPTTLPLAENPTGHAIEGGVDSAPDGSRLTASPEGTIYGANEGVTNEEFGKGEAYAGLTALSGANGSLIGWTGGQEPHAENDQCVLTPYNFGERFISVAAGSEGKVFALAPEFLLRQTEEEEEIWNEEEEEYEKIVRFVPLPGPFSDAVVEFGPGGAGCPPAEATAPVAKVSGIEVKGEESVKPGSEVAFSSQVKQADALKVVWNFGDGTEETVSEDEFQSTASKPHKYAAEGTYTVTETIYSDDLAASEESVYKAGQLETPTLTETRKIHVGRQPAESAVQRTRGRERGRSSRFRKPLHRSRKRDAPGICVELRRRDSRNDPERDAHHEPYLHAGRHVHGDPYRVRPEQTEGRSHALDHRQPGGNWPRSWSWSWSRSRSWSWSRSRQWGAHLQPDAARHVANGELVRCAPAQGRVPRSEQLLRRYRDATDAQRRERGPAQEEGGPDARKRFVHRCGRSGCGRDAAPLLQGPLAAEPLARVACFGDGRGPRLPGRGAHHAEHCDASGGEDQAPPVNVKNQDLYVVALASCDGLSCGGADIPQHDHIPS